MEKDDTQRVLSITEPPAGLFEAIMARIDAAKRRGAQIRAALFGAATFLCALTLVPVLQYTAEQLYASGFYDYLSLVASDHSLVLTYWREFGLSLVESLPSLALLLLLPIAAGFVWSLYRLVKNARVAVKLA